MVKRVITGAHYGFKDWLAQRVTALLMAIYVVVFIGILLVCPPREFEQWRGLFGNQPMRIATILFFISLFWHAWIGMRDILMDYIKPTALRLTAQFAVGFVLLFYLVWTAAILWGR